MRTTEVRCFSLPTKLSGKLEILAQKLYDEEKIRKPTASEAVSYLLAKAIADLQKMEVSATTVTNGQELTRHMANSPRLSPRDSRLKDLNVKQAAALTSYLEALKEVRGIKASWRQIENSSLRFEHSDWRLNICSAYYDPLNPGSVVGLLFGEDNQLIPDFPAIEICPGGRLALPAIRSYPEKKSANSLRPYPHGQTAFDAALFADSHIHKQSRKHPQR
jgi:hypothetical protein